jgi:GNAT superfamily N-acetyltransferase
MNAGSGCSDSALDSSLRIRPADADDDELLTQIQRAASLIAFTHIFPPGRYPFPSDSVRKHWQVELADPDMRVVIAERFGQPIGCASYSLGRLSQLWVVPAEWGKGPADYLYAEIVRGLRALGSSTAHLWVMEQNHRARRFYDRRGWEFDGERRRAAYPPYPELLKYRIRL